MDIFIYITILLLLLVPAIEILEWINKNIWDKLFCKKTKEQTIGDSFFEQLYSNKPQLPRHKPKPRNSYMDISKMVSSSTATTDFDDPDYFKVYYVNLDNIIIKDENNKDKDKPFRSIEI